MCSACEEATPKQHLLISLNKFKRDFKKYFSNQDEAIGYYDNGTKILKHLTSLIQNCPEINIPNPPALERKQIEHIICRTEIQGRVTESTEFCGECCNQVSGTPSTSTLED